MLRLNKKGQVMVITIQNLANKGNGHSGKGHTPPKPNPVRSQACLSIPIILSAQSPDCPESPARQSASISYRMRYDGVSVSILCRSPFMDR
jgi:hypothetical protein